MHLKLRCSILFGKTPITDRFVKIRTLIIETEIKILKTLDMETTF